MTLEYIQNARFIDLDREIEQDRFPKDPTKYEPTRKFIQRRKEIGDAISGSMIDETIRDGYLFPADNDCGCFVRDFDGVAFYIVVGDDRSTLEAVTLWAYVHDANWAVLNYDPIQIKRIRNLDPDYDPMI